MYTANDRGYRCTCMCYGCRIFSQESIPLFRPRLSLSLPLFPSHCLLTGSQKPVWYFLEPHGLALTHSPRPNFSCRPFANAITGQVVSLLWPVVSVGEGGLCSRDFVPELYPGETKQSRAAREAAILGFRGRSSPG